MIKTVLWKFLSSDKEITHEFTIIFNKHLPTLKSLVPNKYFDSNIVDIGILFNTKYNGEHGIYKPFLNEMKENGYIENYLHFLYFFDEYKPNLDSTNKNTTYDGLIVFGKYPHELLPNTFNIKNLFWTNTFLTKIFYGELNLMKYILIMEKIKKRISNF